MTKKRAILWLAVALFFVLFLSNWIISSDTVFFRPFV